MKLFSKTILFIALAIVVSISASDLQGSALEPKQNTGGPRAIQLSSTAAVRGATIEVPVVFSSHGNEAAIMFTAAYDPQVLSSPTVGLGSLPPDRSSLTVNASIPGKLTILVDWDDTFAVGDIHLMTMIFEVNTEATGEETLITLDNVSISDKNAASLTANFDFVVVPISSAKISGRILTPEGRGLRNATVVLTGPDGTARWTTTGSLGYFEFADIAVGTEYNLQVRSKRFRFNTRSVVFNGDAVDLVGVG